MNVLSWSGGKDSTAMLIRALELGYQIDDIIFIDVCFNKNIGGELPEMYDYINKVEKYTGRKVTRLTSEWTFESHFYRQKKKGKFEGQIYGFPLITIANGWCNDRLKLKPIRDYKRKIGEHTMFIGIAADEPKRLTKMKDNERSLLQEWGWTEKDCLDYLKEKGLENPLYRKFKRTGCWFCPKQNKKSLKIIYKDYPELWNKLLQLEKDSPIQFQPNNSIADLNNRFKEEDKQITFF